MSNDIFYYININGQQAGPFSKEGLLEAGLRPNSLVWRSDLPNWVEANTLPELMALFNAGPNPAQYPSNTPPYPSPAYGPQPNPYSASYAPSGYPPQAPVMRNSYPEGWTNWLGWAIAGTIVGGLFYGLGFITGVIAIIFSALANSSAKNGDFSTARSQNSVAKVMTIITLIIAGIALLAIGFLLILFGSLLALIP